MLKSRGLDATMEESTLRFDETDIRYTEMDTEPKTMRYIHFDNENDENENTRITERQHTPNENEGNENKTADEIQTEVTKRFIWFTRKSKMLE
ncbi:hypothetical protein QE152_g32113 [Popillia japonica]|uniref:Uncharacterized protein n=1 Tax=Popillia japonica TaxID=7064 RepID=A0AAW1J088_POPJA